MTFQPPPPPPEGEQPPSAPAYGQPPAPGGPRPGFNPKSVNPLDWGLLATGLLAFIFSFVSYYTASVSYRGLSASGHINAWHGFFGWFGALCALAGSAAVAVAVFAPQVRLNAPPRLISLIAYAVATLCLILAIFIIPIDMDGAPPGASTGHGVGFWISLIVVIIGLALSLMRFQQSGGQLPGALGKIPDIGSRAPGGSGSTTPPPPPPGSPAP